MSSGLFDIGEARSQEAVVAVGFGGLVILQSS
jgi:hypothetical protein